MSRDNVSSNQVLGLRHLASSGHEQDLFEAAASPCHKATHPLVSHCYTGGHTGFSKANISVRIKIRRMLMIMIGNWYIVEVSKNFIL